jgi:WSC domain
LLNAKHIRQCFCGNSLTAPRGLETSCNYACSGDSTKLCGGSKRLNVYYIPKAASTVTTTTTIPASTVSTSTVSVQTVAPAPYFSYSSCNQTAANGVFAEYHGSISVERCAAFCGALIGSASAFAINVGGCYCAGYPAVDDGSVVNGTTPGYMCTDTCYGGVNDDGEDSDDGAGPTGGCGYYSGGFYSYYNL